MGYEVKESEKWKKTQTGREPLQVEHGPLQVRSDAVAPDPPSFLVDFLLRESGIAVATNVSSGQELMDVAATSLAGEVGVVGGRNQADSPRGSAEHVGRGVSEALEAIGVEVILVVDDIVMGGAGGALKATMSLEEEVEVIDRRDSTVDNGSGTGVSIPIGTITVDWVEASVMAFSGDALGDGLVGERVGPNTSDSRE